MASIWVVGAVGLAAGVGFWVPALTGAAISMLSLTFLKPLRAGLRRMGRRAADLTLVLRDGVSPAEIIRVLSEQAPVPPVQIRIGRGERDADPRWSRTMPHATNTSWDGRFARRRPRRRRRGEHRVLTAFRRSWERAHPTSTPNEESRADEEVAPWSSESRSSSEELAPNDIVRVAVLAEEVGFTTAWVSDHYHPWIDA